MTPTQTGDKPMVTLVQCPIGLFMAGDELCLKTEYGNNEGRIDAYIVSSGEFFWGTAPQTIANQRMQMVEPIDAEALLARHREQETPEQPLDTIQRLGQEFDGEQPRLGREIFDREPHIVAHSPEPSLRRLVRKYYNEHFNAIKSDELTEQYFAALSPSPDLAEENERLREALEQAAKWFDQYGVEHDRKASNAVDSYERANRADKARRNHERASHLRSTLQSISTTKGNP